MADHAKAIEDLKAEYMRISVDAHNTGYSAHTVWGAIDRAVAIAQGSRVGTEDEILAAASRPPVDQPMSAEDMIRAIGHPSRVGTDTISSAPMVPNGPAIAAMSPTAERKPFKMQVSPEWVTKMAELEGDYEFDAGVLHPEAPAPAQEADDALREAQNAEIEGISASPNIDQHEEVKRVLFSAAEGFIGSQELSRMAIALSRANLLAGPVVITEAQLEKMSREIAVATVDAHYGFTCEFASSPAAHIEEYAEWQWAVKFGLKQGLGPRVLIAGDAS